MIVTIEWMEEWFRRFDQEYFGENCLFLNSDLLMPRLGWGNLPISGLQMGTHQALRFQALHVYLL